MYRNLRVVLVAIFALALVGCSDDAEVTSGGGNTGVGSDGGNPSAMYAGTYVGEIRTTFSGSEFDDKTSVDRIEIIVRTDGTARVIIEGETVDGTVDGRSVGFSIKYTQEFGPLGEFDCESTAVIKGTINVAGNQINGDASGDGKCEFALVGSTGADLTATFYANKP